MTQKQIRINRMRNALRAYPGITTKEVAGLLGLSINTAARYMAVIRAEWRPLPGLKPETSHVHS